MSGCRLEGAWRAYLDGELPPLEMPAAREHLENCAACAELFREVKGRAQRVRALMAELDRIPDVPVVPRRAANGGRRAAMATLALAAAFAVAFLLLPKRAPERRPAPIPMPAAAAQAMVPPVAVPVPATPAPVRRRAPKAGQARADYFLGLDREPIETGVVVRVALDDGLLADVIVDEHGRPRAVRPVNYEENKR